MYEAEGDVPVRLKVEKVGTLLEGSARLYEARTGGEPK